MFSYYISKFKKVVSTKIIFLGLFILLVLLGCSSSCDSPEALSRPIRSVVDLNLGEKAKVELSDGNTVSIKLLEIKHTRDQFRNAVRSAWTRLMVNGEEVTLHSANYNLPVAVAGIRMDCPITSTYYSNSDYDRWGLEKDARLRLWPGEGPYITSGTFLYPVGQRILANDTQMSNEPCYVDGGEIPGDNDIYYHSGLDFGGSEGLVEVIAATDGIVVSSGDSVLSGHRENTPVMPRYDVVYLLDKRGWYYRYSHMKSIEPWVVPGAKVDKGRRIGLLGKEGGSGGWSHLHFEIKARQPSGKWGTEEAYAYVWQAYIEYYEPDVIAVARPHHLVPVGETVTLDGSKSRHCEREKLDYEWLFTDGGTAKGPVIERMYDKAGTYYEALKVSDHMGNLDYDFAVVQVIDKSHPDRLPPSLHANYYPSLDIKAGEPVTFKVRSFNVREGEEVWDFGDNSPRESTRSVPCYSSDDYAPEKMSYRDIQHHPQGYAEIEHTFAEPGHYLVRIERTGDWELKAVARLHVEVNP